MTERLKLTRGLFALVDNEDFERVSDRPWHAMKVKNRYYACAHYRLGVWQYKNYLLHRVIMNAQPGQQLDHINGNCLDCRKSNLRFVTDEQNQWNRGKHRDNTSGYKGVDWMKSKEKWRARICVNRKEIHIGLYDDIVEAAKAYDRAAIEHHGEYARTNFR